MNPAQCSNPPPVRAVSSCTCNRSSLNTSEPLILLSPLGKSVELSEPFCTCSRPRIEGRARVPFTCRFRFATRRSPSASDRRSPAASGSRCHRHAGRSRACRPAAPRRCTCTNRVPCSPDRRNCSTRITLLPNPKPDRTLVRHGNAAVVGGPAAPPPPRQSYPADAAPHPWNPGASSAPKAPPSAVGK